MNAIAPLVIFALVFLYRFNGLGGTMGGFDNDHFVHFAHARQVMAGELPLRDFLDVGLQGAWPPLTYYTSAAAQWLIGETLLSEALLCVTLLAAAMAVSYIVAVRLGASRWAAGVAALMGAALAPNLYNYPKVFLPAVGLLLLVRVLERESTWRWLMLAAWTAVATLFRNDLGVYVAIAVACAVVVASGANLRAAVRRLTLYGATTALLLAPAAFWIRSHGGLLSYVQAGLAISRRETDRTVLEWPVFEAAVPWSEPNLLAWIYYMFLAVPLLVIVLVAARWRSLPVAQRSGLVAVAALGLVLDAFMLRSNLAARFGDASVPFAIAGAWLMTWLLRPQPGAARWRAAAVPALVLVVLAVTVQAVEGMKRVDIRSAGFSSLPSGPFVRFGRSIDELRLLPPLGWRLGDDEGTLVAARYVALCTAATDRVLAAGYFPEIPVFSRRLFAAGQLNFALGVGESKQDQHRALERLRGQSVPIAITVPVEQFNVEFGDDYPLLAAYLAERYREAGVFEIDAQPRLRILVDRTRQPVGTFDQGDLPCFR